MEVEIKTAKPELIRKISDLLLEYKGTPVSCRQFDILYELTEKKLQGVLDTLTEQLVRN